jgi:DNA (cytosine-5)-methyltransferase 3A
MKNLPLNIVSYFDGMSCLQIACILEGFNIGSYHAGEIKPHAIKVTQENFPNTIQVGDITKFDITSLPTPHLFGAGSPCKDLSQAHKVREGLKGTKSSLFFNWVEDYKKSGAKYFLLENVRMKKEDMDAITKELGVEPFLINSKDVSGALRARYYWTNIPFDGIVKEEEIKLQDVLTHGYTDRLKARCLLESDSRPPATPVKMFHRYYNTGFTTLIFKSDFHYGECKAHFDRHFKGMSAKEIDVAMIDAPQMEVYEGLRYLNQTELERLQNVPEGFTKSLTRNQSASLLGDGWTINVIRQIIRGMEF